MIFPWAIKSECIDVCMHNVNIVHPLLYFQISVSTIVVHVLCDIVDSFYLKHKCLCLNLKAKKEKLLENESSFRTWKESKEDTFVKKIKEEKRKEREKKEKEEKDKQKKIREAEKVDISNL